MSLAKTTLAAACAIDDRQITVASATGIAVGYQIRIDMETLQVTKGYVAGSVIVPVLRGQSGTIAEAHANETMVTVGAAQDFTQNTPPQTKAPFVIAGRARVVASYDADGAIDLPPAGADMLAVLNGSAQLDMTLAVPTKEMNGCKLQVLGAVGSAHTVTVAGGFSGSALVVATFDASGRGCLNLIAYNEIWYTDGSPLSGTLTGIDIALT